MIVRRLLMPVGIALAGILAGCGGWNEVELTAGLENQVASGLEARTLYVRPSGACDEGNTGLSVAQAVCSIQRAYNIAKTYNGDQTVDIGAGNYYCKGATGKWGTFTGYQLLFQGAGMDSTLFYGRTSSSGPSCDTTPDQFGGFVKVNTTYNQNLNLLFKDFMINRYARGIDVQCEACSDGNSSAPQIPTQDNNLVIRRVKFSKIGSVYWSLTPANPPVGAIVLKAQKGTVIRESVFYSILNDGGDEALLHAIYTNLSPYTNIIDNNPFDTCTGGMIKLRNFSNYTTISGNTFIGTAPFAIVDSYQNEAFGWDGKNECPSWRTSITGNSFSGGTWGVGEYHNPNNDAAVGLDNAVSCHTAAPSSIRATCGSTNKGPNQWTCFPPQ